MKEMDNNKKELKESRLMEVTGGMAKPANKEKNSEADPKTNFKTVECWNCKKKFKFPIFEEKLSPMAASLRAAHPEIFKECRHYLCPECSVRSNLPKIRTMK